MKQTYRVIIINKFKLTEVRPVCGNSKIIEVVKIKEFRQVHMNKYNGRIITIKII